jgi:hypothetical protein
MFAGCLLYADNIILISPAVSGLQDMLDLCVTVGKVLSSKFNPLKSSCKQIVYVNLSGWTVLQRNGCILLNILEFILLVGKYYL